MKYYIVYVSKLKNNDYNLLSMPYSGIKYSDFQFAYYEMLEAKRKLYHACIIERED